MAVVLSPVSTSVVRADPPTTVPVAPLLQQLSDQTQHVYASGRLGMVRVRLPTPPWLARENRLRALMAKWGSQLDPAVREHLLEEQERAAVAAGQRPGAAFGTAVNPANGTGPASAPAWPSLPPPGLMSGPLMPGPVLAEPSPAVADRVLVATGVLIDTGGHAVFPLFIDRADLGDSPTLMALTGDGHPTRATFVGSDQKTNLTVLKLAEVGPRCEPMTQAADANTTLAGRPADGSVALVVAPDGSAHLTVWTAASTDVGLVLRPDGAFAGFGFADDFLSIETARPIVEQLIATGIVRRPMLGVAGVAVRRSALFDPAVLAADDAAATAADAAGGPSAVYVRAVEPGSAAARAKLQPADVILSVSGRPVGPRTFAAAIAAGRGPTVLRVRRGSQTLDLTVELRPDE